MAAILDLPRIDAPFLTSTPKKLLFPFTYIILHLLSWCPQLNYEKMNLTAPPTDNCAEFPLIVYWRKNGSRSGTLIRRANVQICSHGFIKKWWCPYISSLKTVPFWILDWKMEKAQVGGAVLSCVVAVFSLTLDWWWTWHYKYLYDL